MKKKPVGGVSMFGGDLFGSSPPQQPSATAAAAAAAAKVCIMGGL